MCGRLTTETNMTKSRNVIHKTSLKESSSDKQNSNGISTCLSLTQAFVYKQSYFLVQVSMLDVSK